MNKQKFDLTEKRPQVLLFGNGLVYNKSWDVVIDELKKGNEKSCFKDKNVPYPLQSSALLSDDDYERWNSYEDYFNKREKEPHYEYKDKYPLIEKIGKMDFDAYLTTNYTYELEREICPKYFTSNKKVDYAKTTKEKKDNKRIKYTYNCFENNGQKKNIWHIHGETRNKSSLIFTHNDYCRLIGDLKEINDNAGNKYEKFKRNFTINSWFDYFIVADIYILGLGVDFSEMDLWWLLCRRLREKSGRGKIYLFEPKLKKQEAKYEIMKKFDVKVEHLNFDDEKEKLSNEEYINFYIQALNKIKKLLEEN